jgi:hypothetical protein
MPASGEPRILKTNDRQLIQIGCGVTAIRGSKCQGSPGRQAPHWIYFLKTATSDVRKETGLRTMDLQHLIQELKAEKNRLDSVIAALEAMQRTESGLAGGPGVPKRRGRKSMGQEERKNVSERMKKHWANRRPNQNVENPVD